MEESLVSLSLGTRRSVPGFRPLHEQVREGKGEPGEEQGGDIQSFEDRSEQGQPFIVPVGRYDVVETVEPDALGHGCPVAQQFLGVFFYQVVHVLLRV